MFGRAYIDAHTLSSSAAYATSIVCGAQWKRLRNSFDNQAVPVLAFKYSSYSTTLLVLPLTTAPTGNMNSKQDVDPMVSEANEHDYEMQSKSKLAGTDTDILEMRAMGKTQQLNVRSFRSC